MKKLVFIFILSLFFVMVGNAQNDALVVEQHNGLADIFPVSTKLRIVNLQDKDSIAITDANDIVATYALTDIKRIAFDTEEILADSVERAALAALYKAMDGDHWKRNTNWLSDKPLSAWEGLGGYEGGHVFYLNLSYNDLNGVIPTEIGNLPYLKFLDLMGNGNISGNIPTSIGRLTELKDFYLGWPSQVTGEIPKEIGNLTKLEELRLFNNKLTGEIPKELSNLKNLFWLDLGANNLSGSIPREFGTMTNLRYLILDRNQLTGEIPSELGNLTNLTELKLSQNQLTGEIPESFNNLTGLIWERSYGYPPMFCLDTWNNGLSGNIPTLFTEHPSWKYEWWNIIAWNPYNNLEDLQIPAPAFHVKDIDGNILDSKDYYPKNKYTAIFHWATWCGYSAALMNEVIPLYKKYKNHGLEIVGFAVDGEGDTKEGIREYIVQKGITWKNFISSEDNMLDYYGSCVSAGWGYPGGSTPEFTLVDTNGRVVFSDWCISRSKIVEFLKSKLGEGDDITMYESTDFSADGQVKTLQTASTEKDIKVVIMGDGYSDRMIADGSYDAAMMRAMNALFTKNIANIYKDKFTVKSVTVVSKNEKIGSGAETALECYNNYQQGIGGNLAKVFNYAKNAINEEDIDDAIIIVILNSELSVGGKEAAICYMYQPETPNTWGRGASVSFVPNFSGNGGIYDVTSFENVLTHEALGHGFAKLADEYYQVSTTISNEQKTNYKNSATKGWYQNVDFTNKATQVKWNEFIKDNRYADEQIGIYQGGATYEKGVYRPTPTSLMGSNGTDFNAPSRKAIWYRINKLTQGNEWEGSYDDFVSFDMNLKSSTTAPQTVPNKRASNTDANRLIYTGAPPIVKNITWREECK